MMVLIVIAGMAVRVFTALNTCVINPDGMEYIQQAKAIYYGDWHLLKSCMSFVSNYPFFIAGVYAFCSDWIFASRAVSVFFGSLTLVPLFFLIRRFVDERTSCLCLLLYAFIPLLVSGSADLIRDPVCWFFLACGLYFFVTQLGMRETGWKRLLTLLSSYAFLFMAGWARPESLIVFGFSVFYSLCYSIRSGDKRSIWMSLAVPLLLAVIVGVGLMFFDPSFHVYYQGASKKVSGSIEQYTELRSQLELMAEDFRGQITGSFLGKVRNLVWLNGIGVLISGSVAGIFYPYFPFFVFGFFGLRERLRRDPEIGYLFTLLIVGYILLFFHVLQFWYFEHRFLYIVVFPACVFAALGIMNVRLFAESKAGWRTPITIAVICLYIAGFGLGKNIKKRDTEKVIFREIAEYIRTREHSPEQYIPVMTSDSSLVRLVPFYVNLEVQKGLCLTDSVTNLGSLEALVQHAKKNNAKYLLWNERHWSKTEIDIHSDQFRHTFTSHGRWFHDACGEIILFHRD